MFWTIVAPEILPAWALNQLLAAMTVRDVYNDAKGMLRTSSEKFQVFVNKGQVIRRRRGIWKTVKKLLSLYEIKEAASQGRY